jgi:hypothetical protein
MEPVQSKRRCICGCIVNIALYFGITIPRTNPVAAKPRAHQSPD